MNTTLYVTVCAGLAGLAACSTPPPADKYPTADSWVEATATAECDSVAPKCGIMPTVCFAARKTVWTNYVAGVGNRKYNPKLAEGAVSSVRAAYADAILKPNELDPNAPGSPFAGTV